MELLISSRVTIFEGGVFPVAVFHEYVLDSPELARQFVFCYHHLYAPLVERHNEIERPSYQLLVLCFESLDLLVRVLQVAQSRNGAGRNSLPQKVCLH